jgi:hypothetical protein
MQNSWLSISFIFNILWYDDYIVTYRPIVKQRLNKHIPAETDSW